MVRSPGLHTRSVARGRVTLQAWRTELMHQNNARLYSGIEPHPPLNSENPKMYASVSPETSSPWAPTFGIKLTQTLPAIVSVVPIPEFWQSLTNLSSVQVTGDQFSCWIARPASPLFTSRRARQRPTERGGAADAQPERRAPISDAAAPPVPAPTSFSPSGRFGQAERQQRGCQLPDHAPAGR